MFEANLNKINLGWAYGSICGGGGGGGGGGGESIKVAAQYSYALDCYVTRSSLHLGMINKPSKFISLGPVVQGAV